VTKPYRFIIKRPPFHAAAKALFRNSYAVDLNHKALEKRRIHRGMPEGFHKLPRPEFYRSAMLTMSMNCLVAGTDFCQGRR